MRLLSRETSGRFRRATLGNTFGLRVYPCPKCAAMNPSNVNEPKPRTCAACGESLAPKAVPCRVCHGTSYVAGVDCEACGGTGFVPA